MNHDDDLEREFQALTDHQPPPARRPVAPLDPAGRVYGYEMVFNGGAARSYAHAISDFIVDLIPGYGALDGNQQWQARLHLAATEQVALQALLCLAHDYDGCSPDAQAILGAGRAHQPVVPTWDEPVPLVLVATYYEPAGQTMRPAAVDGRKANVIWLDPSDEESLLMSLHRCGALTLNAREDLAHALS